MDKLRMQTANKADENFKKLAAMFPNAVTETIDENGEVVRAIDKDALAQEISCRVVDGNEERYQFTWPDKRKSVLLANAPLNKTLRPCREESVDFDTTENLYIEGDNLEVLKLLQETYLGKIKMIYIDPPYNTGNDFVYEDDFAQSADEYLANSGQFDAEGNRMVQNTESNGRFHTDWLNMIYPRLRLAKDLLADDGVIFISIDDNEVENLKKCCDEVFGAANFLSQIVWEKVYTTKNDSSFVSNSHEYLLVYAKRLDVCIFGTLDRTEEMNARYTNPDADIRGPWKAIPLYARGESKNGRFPIVSPVSKKTFFPPADSHWRYSRETLERMLADGRVWFGKNGDSYPSSKRFLSEIGQGVTSKSLWLHTDVGSNDSGLKEMRSLFPERDVFPFPKPSSLIFRVVKLGVPSGGIVLDFFSGSAATAHAVMQLNAEDGGRRKFIMVQLPESCDEKSEAFKAGYRNICEIGKERIRRAGAKIVAELKAKKGKDAPTLFSATEHTERVAPDTERAEVQCVQCAAKGGFSDFSDENAPSQSLPDVGFRVLKCDTSNMKDVYYRPSEYEAAMFAALEDNIKDDRTPEDLLFQVMLDLGVPLSGKIREMTIGGKKVFNVEESYLIACFDRDVTEETITAIAKQKPYYFVMRDSSLANDSVAANFEQIFAAYSPETIRKVL